MNPPRRGFFAFADRVGLALVLAVVVALAGIVVLQNTSWWSSVQATLVRREDAKAFLARHGVLVPLRQDLGDAHWAVATGNPLAQRFFDQGLRWMVGYNFKLALASFLQCETLDPGCAMCAWGEAMSRGQNLNVRETGECCLFTHCCRRSTWICQRTMCIVRTVQWSGPWR